MANYKQLSQEQRYQIYGMLRVKRTQKEIANVIGVEKSTICRELARNTGQRGYRPIQAHKMALQRREENVRFGISETTWKRVEQLLREYWSPKQISLRLKKENEPSASHESIRIILAVLLQRIALRLHRTHQ